MIVAGIISLGLAILKLGTMVTFILTFIAVGMVVGSWIISGIVPSIIYYG